jgi:hypothetical protein
MIKEKVKNSNEGNLIIISNIFNIFFFSFCRLVPRVRKKYSIKKKCKILRGKKRKV